MLKNITAKLTRCRHGRPLVVLDSDPFNGLEARPAELLALAEHLRGLAALAIEHNLAPRYTGDKRVSLEIEHV